MAESGLGFFIGYSASFIKVPQAFAGLAVLVVGLQPEDVLNRCLGINPLRISVTAKNRMGTVGYARNHWGSVRAVTQHVCFRATHDPDGTSETVKDFGCRQAYESLLIQEPAPTHSDLWYFIF